MFVVFVCLEGSLSLVGRRNTGRQRGHSMCLWPLEHITPCLPHCLHNSMLLWGLLQTYLESQSLLPGREKMADYSFNSLFSCISAFFIPLRFYLSLCLWVSFWQSRIALIDRHLVPLRACLQLNGCHCFSVYHLFIFGQVCGTYPQFLNVEECQNQCKVFSHIDLQFLLIFMIPMNGYIIL